MRRATSIGLVVILVAGCGGGGGGGGGRCGPGLTPCGGGCADLTSDDANCGACGEACPGGQHCAAGACQPGPPTSKIKHVVLIVEENHTFDAYFGLYCRAPAYSDPTCTDGPDCCEAAPDHEPGGAAPLLLDDDPNNDASNFATDRDHDRDCEIQQIDGGKMDHFVSGAGGAATCFGIGPDCASPNNWVLADQPTVGAYWALADQNALADRYFQPVVGSTSSNDMYFAVAQYQFVDNSVAPATAGAGCMGSPCATDQRASYQGRTTIADVLLGAGKTFRVYADGFADAKAAAPGCPDPSSDCRYAPTFTCDASLHPIACHACIYDPTDIPFAYYAQIGDGYTSDYNALSDDLADGKLPDFAYVKAKSWRNEHPNVSTIADGVAFVTATLQMIEASQYASSTLVLLTWDEGGGFFDHVAPPPPGSDGQPYGTRVPLLAIGRFARRGAVSHVEMEHSSIVKFLEWNFTGATGQLGARDAAVHNIGSLLDPSTTGVPVP